MNDHSEAGFLLASNSSIPKDDPLPGVVMEAKDAMLLKLLEELVRAWGQAYSPAEIRQDLAKIQLLNQVHSSVAEGCKPSKMVQQFYSEVFLRDVWSGAGSQSRGTA